MWYVKEPYHTGHLVGHADTFVGLGVIFDPRRLSEQKKGAGGISGASI